MFCVSCGNELPENAAFCSKCGSKVGATGNPVISSSDASKLYILIAHLGGIFFGFIPSLIVFLLVKDEPGCLQDNAREALNWQITVILGGIVCFILAFVLIGILLWWLLYVANVILCIVAAIQSGPNTVYRYPCSIRLLKP
ncbi:MAG: hypothetical protein H6R04_420 [Burkholderiaceae bacterium]|nr:hypothetical protein [Burkholderiaceae bacterium]